MKKVFSTPIKIILVLFIISILGTNIRCTGKASNSEKINSTLTDKPILDEIKTNEVKSLTSSNFDKNIESGLVLVDFWATWCRPCKIQGPIIQQVSDELSGKVSVFKIDIDYSPAIADRYNIQSIPTMILFKDGEAVGQFIGVTQKSDIINSIEKFIENK